MLPTSQCISSVSLLSHSTSFEEFGKCWPIHGEQFRVHCLFYIYELVAKGILHLFILTLLLYLSCLFSVSMLVWTRWCCCWWSWTSWTRRLRMRSVPPPPWTAPRPFIGDNPWYAPACHPAGFSQLLVRTFDSSNDLRLVFHVPRWQFWVVEMSINLLTCW